MKVVKVYGALRKRLGQCRFEFDVNTPAQAIKALCVNFPGLEKWLADSEQDGVGYRVAISKEKVTEQSAASLYMPFSDKEVFSITPVVAGAGRGTGAILLGAALIAVAIANPLAGFGVKGAIGFGAYAGGAFAASLGNIGIALVLGGVSQAISPQPADDDKKKAIELESFDVSNVVNTSRQGLPVPIAYGRVWVGSAVISSSLDVDQLEV